MVKEKDELFKRLEKQENCKHKNIYHEVTTETNLMHKCKDCGMWWLLGPD